jgi:hypothetical protein
MSQLVGPCHICLQQIKKVDERERAAFVKQDQFRSPEWLTEAATNLLL